MLPGSRGAVIAARVVAAATLGAATLLVGREAAACKCSYSGTKISAPRFTGPIALKKESVVLRCEPAARGFLVCTWVARYGLENAGEGPRTFELAVGHVEGARVSLAIAGVVAANTTAEDLRAPARGGPRRGMARTSLVWDARYLESTTLTVMATFLVAPWECCQYPTNKRRHPWVTRWRSNWYFVNYVPGDEFSAAPATYSLELDVPARWRGDPRGFGRRGTMSREGDRRVGRSTRPRPRDDPYDEGGTIGLSRPLLGDAGGPVVAAGVGWSPEGVRPRLRVGWEVAWPQLLVHSVVVETDARRRLAIVPAWELAIPEWHVVFPDLGVGLGVPVQLLPEARPGVRVQGRFGFWIFHLIGTFDHFPALRGLPRERLGALMLQVGF